MKKTFLFALLSLVLVACSQDEPVILPDKTKAGTKSEHRVSLDDALKTADALLAQIGNPDTRSKSRRVANVKYLASVLTRSGAIDTMLYLVKVVGGEQLHDILYHCVWGWAGNSNGYFYWTRTNSFSGGPIEKDSNSNNMIIENGIVKEIKYMGGFTPIK